MEADLKELELVRKAIELGRRFHGYCEWAESAAKRVREKPPCEGLTPEGIRILLCDFIVGGGAIAQVHEKRQEKRDEGFRFYYKAILPVPAFPWGLFVELVVVDNDDDDPAVVIVNAHEQVG